MFASNRLSVIDGSLRVQPTAPNTVTASKSVANFGYGSYGNLQFSGGASTAVTLGAPTGIFQSSGSPLEGIVPDTDEYRLLPFYRNIYYYDAIGGSTCDLLANFPFSEWTLTNVDNDIAQKYTDSLARLNIRTLLPDMALRYLVDGDMISSLIFDPQSKTFVDIVVHDKQYCQIVPSPLEALDPIIRVNASQLFDRYLSRKGNLSSNLKRVYGAQQVQVFRTGTVELDPLTTLYMSRRGIEPYRGGISLLKRMLPIWLMERTLYRGTLVEAARRQRSTTHIQAGDDTWEPTDGEMASILSQFQASDLEPLGAYVVTRQGVQVSDVRVAGDFWKWTDTADQFTPMKLRALSTSEAFLSAEASYSNSESALVVFLENCESFRNYLTYRLFYYRLFPMIAVLNGFFKKGSEIQKQDSIDDVLYNAANQKNLMIPKIDWTKDLSGKDSTSRIELLEKLDEKGFPVTLKAWAAASGVSIDSALGDLDADVELQKQVKKYKEKLEGGDEDTGGEGEGLDGGEFASRRVPLRKRSLLSRSFNRKVVQKSKSGNVEHAVLNEKAALRAENERINKAMTNLQDPNVREAAKKRVIAKLGGIPQFVTKGR